MWPFGAGSSKMWVEVGRSGSEGSAFPTWVPSRALKRLVNRRGREAGKQNLPDVTAPRPLPHPSQALWLISETESALANCRQFASQLFEPIGKTITDEANELFVPPANATETKQWLRHASALNLAVTQLYQLESALDARLDRIASAGNVLMHELRTQLLAKHDYRSDVQRLWEAPIARVEAEHHDFGQSHAKDTLERLVAQVGDGWRHATYEAPGDTRTENSSGSEMHESRLPKVRDDFHAND